MQKEENNSSPGRLVNAMNAMDGAYALKAKQLDEKPNVMLILYELTTRESSQKQISDALLIPLSTINTVVREMASRGLLAQEPIHGSRRECLLKLTVKGRRYASRLLKPFQEAERIALEGTVGQYGPQFVDAFEKYVQVLKREFGLERR